MRTPVDNAARHCLKLNADYTPVQVIDWTAAMELVLAEKAIVVETVPGKYVRSEHLVIPWPSVIALKKFKLVKGRIKFSGKNVILRDRGVCNYCGVAPRARDGGIDRTELTMDHVIPRAQGKRESGAVFLPWNKRWVNVTSWENATTACKACNSRKADRTPDQAGMTLRILPRTPSHSDVVRMALARIRQLPEEWLQYLPEQTPVLSNTPDVAEDIRSRIIKLG